MKAPSNRSSRPDATRVTPRAALVAVCLVLLGAAISYAAAGDLDTGFGSGGKVTTAIGPEDESANDLAIQPDGKLVVAGSKYESSDYDFMVARYGPGGSLDPTFSGDGTATTAIGSSWDRADAVAVQPDGKIVAVGMASVAGNYDFALARYNADGSLDTTGFAAPSGKVTVPYSGFNDQLYDVLVQTDGKIVVGGFGNDGSKDSFVVGRYNSNGTIDGTFGWITTSIGPSSSRAMAIALQPDGKVVAAGYASNGSDFDFAAARYDTDGSPDLTFGGSGKVTTSISAGSDVANAVIVQPDGKIVLVGSSTNGSLKNFALVRYSANGTLDPTFGIGGKIESAFGAKSYEAFDADRQSDGKIVAAGLVNFATEQDFQLARYNTDGSLDSSFGSGGSIVTPINPAAESVNGVKIQSDGKIAVAGWTNNGSNKDIALARYLGDPAPASPASPVPVATITSPSGKSVRAKKLRKFAGTAGPAGEVASVSIALQRVDRRLLKRAKRCLWLKNARGVFRKVKAKKRKCATPVFLTAKGAESWSFALKRKLPKGSYRLFARVTLKNGTTQTEFTKSGGNLREFRVR